MPLLQYGFADVRQILAICLLLLGCGTRGTAKSETSLPVSDLRAAQAETLSQLSGASDPSSGWPSASDCDGALWAGEAAFAGASSVNIALALQPDGRPTREPGHDCPPPGAPGGASHTTSTDMQLGTILGLYGARDAASLELLQSYTEDNGGIVGTPDAVVTDLAYVEMKPGQRSLMAMAVWQLGGSPAEPWLHTPIVYGPPQNDSSLHLALLSLAGERELGSFGEADQLVADSLLVGASGDALAQAVAGNSSTAAALILSPSYSPPSYVRGSLPAYAYVHKLLVLHILLSP